MGYTIQADLTPLLLLIAVFMATYMLAASWGVPFGLDPMDAEFKGYANYVGAKGRDGFGTETKPETLANLALLADLGRMLGTPRNHLMAGVGFDYWSNKFGGANKWVMAPMVMLQLHF